VSGWKQIGEPRDDPLGDPDVWLVPYYRFFDGGDCILNYYRFPRGTLFIKNAGSNLRYYKWKKSIPCNAQTLEPLDREWIEGDLKPKPKKKQTLIQIDDVEWGDWIDPFMVLVEERK